MFGKYRKIPSKNDKEYKDLKIFARSKSAKFIAIMMLNIVLGNSKFAKWITKNVAAKQYIETDNLWIKQLDNELKQFEENYGADKEDKKDEDNDEFNYSATLIAWIKQLNKGTISRKDILSDIQTIYGAGLDSTTAILTICILVLCKYPNVQEKIYNELDSFTRKHNDHNGQYMLANMHELHIFRAAVEEMIRVGNENDPLTIVMVPRVVLEDGLKINGYNIPKYAQLISFNEYIRRDPRHFVNPSKFDLNNFLDQEGKFKSNPVNLGFGFGRRACPGIMLAKRMIYILLGQMVLNYQFNSIDAKNTKIRIEIIVDSFVYVRKR